MQIDSVWCSSFISVKKYVAAHIIVRANGKSEATFLKTEKENCILHSTCFFQGSQWQFQYEKAVAEHFNRSFEG